MPKKPPRDNPYGRPQRTVQSAASVLQRISQRSGVVIPPAGRAANAAGGLLERLRETLPAELRPHLLDAMEKHDELVCFVDSAVWAGRLKLAFAEAQQGNAPRRVTLKVMPQDGYRR